MIVTVSEQTGATDRRSEIAEAGIHLIAARGVRALTHRAIDAALDLPAGSTSYYARTRHDLVKLIVQRLATRTTTDMSRTSVPDCLTVEQAATLIARGLDATLLRADEHLVRIALHIEYRSDPAMLDALAGDPPIRQRLILAAEELLSRLGVAEPARYAPDLVTLIDSLLMQQTVREASTNTEDIVHAYLDGIVHSSAPY